MTAALAPLIEVAETLADAFKAWLDQVDCAEVTLLAHHERSRAVLRYFGDRPLADFAGKPGGEVVADYLRSEMGGKDRGLRERFGGPGNLVRALSYSTCRQRVNSLRLALEHAVARGALSSMPEPWPIPPAGSHGQVARARYLLKPELEAALQREPRKRRMPVSMSKSSAPIVPAPSGSATLGEVLNNFLKYGQLRVAKATREMHEDHVRRLKHFFGADRALSEFRGSAGYRLLMEYVEKEGPSGRGVKFVSIRKPLNTLAMALRESVKRGDLDAVPPWPELPSDAEPRERYLTVSEYWRIRSVISPPWDVATAIGVWTGQHTSDIMTMTYAMVDLGAGPGAGPGPGPAFWLRRNTKNKKKPAWLPMPDDLREALTAAHQQNPPQDPNVVIVSGHQDQFRKHLRRACRKLGIPVAAPIDLRRSCATWWIERGGPKEALRRWLGHAQNSAMVERHYSQITPDMVDGGVQALNRAARDPGSSGPSGPHYVGPSGPHYVGPRLLPKKGQD